MWNIKGNIFCVEYVPGVDAGMFMFLDFSCSSSVLLTQHKRMLSFLQLCESCI